MGQVIIIIGLIGSLITIGTFIVRNREGLKDTLADWTRRGRKVIYIWVLHNESGDVILYLYLCGEETSL